MWKRRLNLRRWLGQRPPPGGHLSLPTALEWTDDVSTGCADCNGWQWPYGFELTELDMPGWQSLKSRPELLPRRLR